MPKSNKYQALTIILLVAIIVIGGLVTWSKYRQNQPIEISLPPGQEIQGKVYIGGAINNPGVYPLKTGDTLDELIQAGGGTSAEADFNQLKLYIPAIDEEEQAQKVDLNRAEAWLLQALPEIGESRAQAIIEYRQHNGQFQNINELTKIQGIGTITYEKIKHLITVSD